MHIFSLLLAAVVLSVGVAEAAPLRTLYVAPTGSDSAAGGAITPWRTLQHAANVVRAGDQVDRAGRPLRGLQSARRAAPRPTRSRSAPIPASSSTRPPGAHAGRHQPGRGRLRRDRRLHRRYGMPRAGIRSVTNHHVTIRNNSGDTERPLGHPHRLQRRPADREQRDVPLGGRARHLRVQQRRSPGDPRQPRAGATPATAST